MVTQSQGFVRWISVRVDCVTFFCALLAKSWQGGLCNQISTHFLLQISATMIFIYCNIRKGQVQSIIKPALFDFHALFTQPSFHSMSTTLFSSSWLSLLTLTRLWGRVLACCCLTWPTTCRSPSWPAPPEGPFHSAWRLWAVPVHADWLDNAHLAWLQTLTLLDSKAMLVKSDQEVLSI